MTPEELKAIPLLKEQTQEFLHFIGPFFQEKTYSPQTVLFKAPQLQTHLYIVLSGEVRFFKQNNQTQTLVHMYRPGDFFGEEALFTSSFAQADAVCLGAARLLEISSEAFHFWAQKYTRSAVGLLFQLAASLAKRLNEHNPLIEDLFKDPKALEMGRKFSAKQMEA